MICAGNEGRRRRTEIRAGFIFQRIGRAAAGGHRSRTDHPVHMNNSDLCHDVIHSLRSQIEETIPRTVLGRNPSSLLRIRWPKGARAASIHSKDTATDTPCSTATSAGKILMRICASHVPVPARGWVASLSAATEDDAVRRSLVPEMPIIV